MKILAVGSHPDDCELYCSGTILRLLEFGVKVFFLVLTPGKTKKRVRIEESEMAWDILGVGGTIGLKGCRSGYLRHDLALVDHIDWYMRENRPNVVVSHCLEDYHQDHVAVAKSVRSALRGKDISWITYPFHGRFARFPHNLVVDIRDYLKTKKEVLDCFKSQKDKWYMKLAKADKVERFKVERAVWGKKGGF